MLMSSTLLSQSGHVPRLSALLSLSVSSVCILGLSALSCYLPIPKSSTPLFSSSYVPGSFALPSPSASSMRMPMSSVLFMSNMHMLEFSIPPSLSGHLSISKSSTSPSLFTSSVHVPGLSALSASGI